MRVLLVATNREQSPFPVSPLGVLAVAGAAVAAGHEVDLVDCMFAPEPVAALDRALATKPYDVLGFGIRNLDNSFWSAPRHYFADVHPLIEAARRATTAPIVLGGSGFSVAPQGWLSRLDVDHGVVGEGEVAFPALLAALAAGRRPDGIPGVVSPASVARDRHDNRGRSAPDPTCFVWDVAALTPPAHHLVDYGRYVRRGGFVTVQAKRGCAFACGYCVYPQLEGATYRYRPVEAIVEEIEAVVRAQGVRQFFFADSVFNVPRAPALELCRAIARRDLGVRWMAYVNATGFDEELARAMLRAGCVGVEFGFDAVTEKMLRAWRKPFGRRDVARSLRACHDAGLPAAVHLLFGGPGETVDDIEESQAYLDACAPVDAVFASLGVRLYEGAPIAARARAEGVIDTGTDLFLPAWYVSTGLGPSPIGTLDAIARRRDHWTTATDWTSREMRVVQASAHRFGGQPLWRNVREYGRRLRARRR